MENHADGLARMLAIIAIVIVAILALIFLFTMRTRADITQVTSKTTAVTANGHRGVITTVALTDAADTEFIFTVNNNKVKADSVILLNTQYSGASATLAYVQSVSAGSFIVRVRNVGTAALNALTKVHYQVL
jgi:hypothetical protein